MIVTQQIEEVPESYPDVEGIEAAAAAIAWQRIEHFIAWRFAPRTVTWRVSSDGCDWTPPLAPIVSITVQTGDDDPYEPEVREAGGWALPEGYVTVTATVGSEPVPAAVAEAVRRYTTHMSAIASYPVGATGISSGSLSLSYRAELINPAKAMANSGAADLLRAYRKV